jgi:ubiquinone/menaquinone biosynthesis C-methylase UbiE
MDVDDMEGSVSEAARVLKPGGRMCVCVTHPLADAGSFSSGEPNSPFVIEGSYLGPRRWFHGTAEKDGLTMKFAGWAYPLEAYAQALEKVGFRIEALREPSASDERWRRIPMFLMWRAVKA